MITEFNSKAVSEILDKLAVALEGVAEEYGLRLEQRKCAYHRDQMPVSFRLHIIERDERGEMTPERKEFERVCDKYGMAPEHFGAHFKHAGIAFRLVGINARRRKYPMTAEVVSRPGHLVKLPEAVVRGALGLATLYDPFEGLGGEVER